MTWLNFHRNSESLAVLAHEAKQAGEIEKANELFIASAEAEAAAFSELKSNQPRTLGITSVSATALYFKGGELKQAENFAHSAMSLPYLPSFARSELRALLQSIWNEIAQAEAGVKFVPGQVVVSVKGGEVVTGGAPLDLILSKVQVIQNIFYRTAEFLKDCPLRLQGPPNKTIQERYRPWLFQAVPGSYQFIVAVQSPPQSDFFVTDDPAPELLTETFLDILRASADEQTSTIESVVPDEGYRKVFLKLTRNLAPTGKTFESMEIKGTKDQSGVSLSSASRKQINSYLRSPVATQSPAVDTEVELAGVLRAVDLDNDWLEITNTSGVHIRVSNVGEAIDDLIGPMVNHTVIVRAKKNIHGSHKFVDIESDE